MIRVRVVIHWAATAAALFEPLTLTPQFGYTALIGAGWFGHAECARLLLDAGADKNATNQVCESVRHSAFYVCRRWTFLYSLFVFARMPYVSLLW